MRFRRKLENLELAIQKIDDALLIVYAYKRDKKYIPTKSDLLLFERFQSTLHFHYATASYTSRTMSQRYAGEPEGAKRYTNSEVRRWYYGDK